MANPITFRNVRSSVDAGGLTKALQLAGQQFNQGAEGLGNFFQTEGDIQADERTRTKQAFIDDLISKGPEAVQQAQQQGLLSNDALSQGGRVNDSLYTSAGGALGKSRDQFNATQAFAKTKRDIAEKPLLAEINELAAIGNYTGATNLANKYKSEGKLSDVSSMLGDFRTKGFVEEDRVQKISGNNLVNDSFNSTDRTNFSQNYGDLKKKLEGAGLDSAEVNSHLANYKSNVDNRNPLDKFQLEDINNRTAIVTDGVERRIQYETEDAQLANSLIPAVSGRLSPEERANQSAQVLEKIAKMSEDGTLFPGFNAGNELIQEVGTYLDTGVDGKAIAPWMANLAVTKLMERGNFFTDDGINTELLKTTLSGYVDNEALAREQHATQIKKSSKRIRNLQNSKVATLTNYTQALKDDRRYGGNTAQGILDKWSAINPDAPVEVKKKKKEEIIKELKSTTEDTTDTSSNTTPTVAEQLSAAGIKATPSAASTIITNLGNSLKASEQNRIKNRDDAAAAAKITATNKNTPAEINKRIEGFKTSVPDARRVSQAKGWIERLRKDNEIATRGWELLSSFGGIDVAYLKAAGATEDEIKKVNKFTEITNK